MFCKIPNEIVVHEDYAEIFLRNNLNKKVSCKIDIDDIEKVKLLRWKLNTRGYAEACRKIDGKRYYILMHRYIIDAPEASVVDHENGDKLENRKYNLQVSTTKKNNFNRDMIKPTINKLARKVNFNDLISLQNFYNQVTNVVNS